MDKQEYLDKKIKPIMENIIFQLALETPDDPASFMVNWLQKTGGYTGNGLTKEEKEELDNLKSEIIKYRKNEELYGQYNIQDGNELISDSDEDEEEKKDVVISKAIETKEQHHNIIGRKGISAESYGKFNVKEKFIPPVIKKNESQITRIKGRILQSFLFSDLDHSDLNIVINAMDERHFSPGEVIIKQGDSGDCWYIIESGEWNCTKAFPDNPKVEKFWKTYSAGEAFGEMALLYNAPRAATIKAKTKAIVWSWDRDTFNNIVKDSAQSKREKYGKFLRSVELFSSMEPYEISQISEALKKCAFKEGEIIIKQGEIGDVFYIIEEGETMAYGNKDITGKNSIPDMNYTKGSYFGELSWWRDQPRAANVKAKTDCKLLSLDRTSFKRVWGPIEDILKRNAAQYKKFVNKVNKK